MRVLDRPVQVSTSVGPLGTRVAIFLVRRMRAHELSNPLSEFRRCLVTDAAPCHHSDLVGCAESEPVNLIRDSLDPPDRVGRADIHFSAR